MAKLEWKNWKALNLNPEKLEEIGAFFDARSEVYDTVHPAGLDGGMTGKEKIADLLPLDTVEIVDFGVGTGLELAAIFRRLPTARVTGVDLAVKMMEKLKEKYAGYAVETVIADYLSYDFGTAHWDAAVSSMTMHHYDHPTKLAFYRRIYNGLKPGGVYIENDFILTPEGTENPEEVERERRAEYLRLVESQKLDDTKQYHYDTPFALSHQIAVLEEAGFQVAKEWQSNNNVLLKAVK